MPRVTQHGRASQQTTMRSAVQGEGLEERRGRQGVEVAVGGTLEGH